MRVKGEKGREKERREVGVLCIEGEKVMNLD